MNYDTWFNRKWRPAMGWSYIVTCICDFVVFPVLWSILQAVSHGSVTSQWNPVTLQGAGLYHVAMGSVLGITAWWRSKEKLAGLSMDSESPESKKDVKKILS
jgi:hypothetical protein